MPGKNPPAISRSATAAGGDEMNSLLDYKASFDLARIGLAHAAPDGSLRAANRQLCEMLGYPLDEILALSFPDLTHSEDLAQDAEYLRLSLEGAIAHYAIEKRFLRKNGEILWAGVTATLVREQGAGAPSYFIVVVEDIGARKQMERELRDNEERLRLAVDGTEIGTWHWDIPRSVLYWSDTTSALLGLSDVSAPTYELFMSAIHPDDREATHRAVLAAVENKAGYDVEYRTIWPDGSLHWHISRGRCYYDDQGVAFRMEGILIDITERRQAEQLLRRSREDLQFAISAAQLGTFYCDWPLDKIIWNETCKRHFFLPGDAEIDFDLFYSLLHPDDRDPTRQAIERAMAERVDYNVEYRALAPDGRTRWINAVGRFYYGSDGSPVRFDGITTDISERKALEMVRERRLVEAQGSAAREKNIARQLQSAIQPQLPDRIPGLKLADYYRAALDESSIGGDFTDVFPIEKGRYALVMGDVSGKGLAAASQVATVRNMLRATLYLSPSVSEAVTILNTMLTERDLLAGFVTLFVGVFEAAASSLTYVSCGHEPGLLRRARGGEIVELLPTGAVVGMAANLSFGEDVVNLAPGDAVLLYTDGISEAGQDRGSLTGTERLKRLFRRRGPVPQEPQIEVAQLIAGVEAEAGGIIRDDACLLLICSEP